jgi:hypothetical protein
VWLPDNDDVASSNTLVSVNQSEKSLDVLPHEIPIWQSESNFYNIFEEPKQEEYIRRELSVSRIYKYNDQLH